MGVLLLLLVTLTAAAGDFVTRGCRRGVMKAPTALRRGEGPVRQPGGDFYVGDRRQLVVLVSFPDLTFTDDDPSATLGKFDKIFNAVGYTEEPYRGSVHDYFYDQSNGKFRLSFDLEYVALTTDRTKYRSTSADDENSQYLVQDVTEVLRTRDIDWSQYDWNGDGYVNQIIIIYPGKGMNDGGDNRSIWPHQWWLSQHLKDRQEDVFCDPVTVSYNGVDYKVDCYCALQELGGVCNPFGTICHEYTHCFGFPDFYYGSTAFAGYWELMDRGNISGSGFCPPNYSAHERWLMGWLTPRELTEATTVTNMLPLGSADVLVDEPQAYLVRNDGWTDEYYIIENRQQQGWDSALPGSGIAIFHIDFDSDIWCGATMEYANTSSYQRYTIFRANNSSIASGWAYPCTTSGKENNCLTDDSLPAATLNHANSAGTMKMGKSITNMSLTGTLASFDFLGGTTVVYQTRSHSASQLLYQFGPINIIRNAQGEVKKVIK